MNIRKMECINIFTNVSIVIRSANETEDQRLTSYISHLEALNGSMLIYNHLKHLVDQAYDIANFTLSFPEICREAPNDFRIKIIDQSKLTAKK